MKKIMIALAFLVMANLAADAHRIYHNVPGRISIQRFYDELSPYGEWINTPDYGYVWRPFSDGMNEDFRPYSTGGNWAYTGLGWTWVSDYPWGWATFHYGRWYFDDYLGWMWVPGYEWAPAWVTWGSYNDYWAWAPMAPGVSINLAVNAYPPDFWWVFVPRRHFCDHNWHAHIWHHHDHPVIVNHITIINDTRYDRRSGHDNGNGNWYHGPRVKEVERYSTTRVHTREILDTERPGTRLAGRDRVEVYRPEVSRESKDTRPTRFRSTEEVRKESATTRTTRTETKTRQGENGKVDRTTRTAPPAVQGTNPEPATRTRIERTTRSRPPVEVRERTERKRTEPVMRSGDSKTERKTTTPTEIRSRNSEQNSPASGGRTTKKEEKQAPKRASRSGQGDR